MRLFTSLAVQYYANVRYIPFIDGLIGTMENKTYVIALGALFALTALLIAVPATFAFGSTFNCNLSAGSNCGESHTAYYFTSYVKSTSPSVTICAGYEISGTVTCNDVSAGNNGAGFSEMSSVSFSSYYRNDGSQSTSGSFTDTWCNCFGPSP